jgi:hypothetical protein
MQSYSEQRGLKNRKQSKRISLMMDEDVEVKLRLLQSKLIRKNQTYVSFSKVVNQFIRKNLKSI